MSEDVKKLAEDLITFSLNERSRGGYLTKYYKAKRYYRGDHDIKERHRRAKIYNKVSEIIKNRIAHLMDAELKWNFYSQENSDVFITRALQQILSDVIWDYIEWDRKKEDLFHYAALAGTAWVKIVVDGNGWPNFIVISPKAILTDRAKSIQDSRFIIHLVAQNVQEIKRKYGVDVSPEPNIYAGTEYETEEGFYDAGDKKMPADIRKLSEFNDRDEQGKAIVAEIWMDDFTMVPIKFDKEEFQRRVELIESGQKPPVIPIDNHPRYIQEYKKLRDKYIPGEDDAKLQIIDELINEHLLYPQETKLPKYPRGRIISICQGKVLRDIPNPLPIHWKDVFIPMDWFKDPDYIWGKSLVEDLFDLQDLLNEGDKLIRDNTNTITAGFIKVRYALYKKIADKLKFDSIARKVLPFLAPDDIQVDFGKALPAHYYVNVNRYENNMDKVSGYTDIMAGRFPTGSPPGITVSQLLTEGKSIIRLILRHYAVLLEKMAMNAILIMNEYMDEGERFEIMGMDNQKQYINWGDIKTKIDVLKNIRIRVATQMPSTKQEKMKQALELFQAGVYDRQAVLEEVDDPKKFDVLQRINEIETLKGLVQQLATENDELKKQLNTVLNRLQGELGIGNVGVPTRG